MSINRWLNKEDAVHNEILLSHKKEWHPAICHNGHGPREYYAKWNNSKTLYVNTYMWSLKIKETNIYSKIVLWGREEKRGKKQDRGMGLKRGINHYVQNRWAKGYLVHNMKYSYNFVITLNGVWSIKMNHYHTLKTLTLTLHLTL